MKKLVFILALAITSANALVAQSNSRLSTTELTFLVDITDADVFSIIRSDFEQNLPTFFQSTGLGKIKELEKFTLSVAPINSTGELVLTSKSIAIPKKGMSAQDIKRHSSAQPLMAMLRQRLCVFDSIKTANSERSYIIDIILKTIAQTDESSERSVIVVCSDLLEFSSILNMYKNIPANQDMAQVLKNIDATILARAQQKINAGCDPEIIIVLKQKAGTKANASKLKEFWNGFLKQVGIITVVFIDNFTQNPQI